MSLAWSVADATLDANTFAAHLDACVTDDGKDYLLTGTALHLLAADTESSPPDKQTLRPAS